MPYQRFYGLAESPFGLTPDSRFLFASETHKEALAHIAYGIAERRGFVMILGEVGTGKTTLVRHVLRSLGPDVKPVFVFNPNLAFEELLQVVLRDLEAPVPGRRRADLIDALNERLLAEHEAGRRVVLIIDEAQHLSSSVLEDIRMLSNLETARSKLLQIVLVGQPELGARLGRPSLRQLRQRIGLVAELAPLSRRDTVRYVRHRLAVAGCSRRVFTRPALRAVHRRARGIPRLINVICDKALVLGYGGDRRRIGWRIVRQVTRDWAAFDAPPRPGAERPSRRRGSGRLRLGGLPVAAAAGLALAAVSAASLATIRPELLAWRPAHGPARAVVGGTAPSSAVDARERALPDIRPVDWRRSDRDRAVPPATTPDSVRQDGSDPAPPILPSRDVLTVPVAISPPEHPLAVVTVERSDTLPWLLHSIYGREDPTVADVVQAVNSGADAEAPRPGRRLYFPALGPSTMVHRLAERRYVVHILTATDPGNPALHRLADEVTAAGHMVRLVPVRLWTGCASCVRLWAGEFSSREEAEAFYRRLRPEGAA